jgi:dephospho-CoA kinase
MLLVGLTGGVASGKTTVSEILREEGAEIIDADEIARRLVEPLQPAWSEIKEVFGDEIFDAKGMLLRKKLAARVFSDPGQRKRLNQILHPRIGREIQDRLREIVKRNPCAVVIVDAALLVETGNYRDMDKVIVVASSAAQQVARMKIRDGLEEEQARAVLSSQAPMEEKLKVADFVISNEGSLEETKKRAREIFEELKRISFEKEARGYHSKGGIEERT